VKQRILCFAAGIIISLLPLESTPYLRSTEGYAAERSVIKSYPIKTDPSGPVAFVKTVPLKKGTITEHITVYGLVIAAPGAVKTVSMPYESQVLGIMVNEGQRVSKGDVLLNMQPSPDTRLQLNQAENAYSLSKQSYQETQRRYRLKLATNAQLLQARQSLDQAKLRLESMKNRGIDGQSSVASDVGGLIKKIYIQEGSIVPAGHPILDIVAENRLEVLLGVETEDIEKVHIGQAVSLRRVNVTGSPGAAGKVRKLSYAVDPTTRLVDVFITLSSSAGFLLGESIEGKIVTNAAEGLIVPRSAVLPEGNHYVLFTVKDGRAVKHTVEIGFENAGQYQVIGKDLEAGQEVVVLGNYELTDGMAVTTEPVK